MRREEIWAEDLDWIEDEETIDEMLGGILVLLETEGVTVLASGAAIRVAATNVPGSRTASGTTDPSHSG